MARQCILLVDDDPLITEALELTLEREGRTLVSCADLESAEIALSRYPVTHFVSDVQFSGPFAFEGLHFVSRVRSFAPGCRVVLITGAASDALRTMAEHDGAGAVLQKPFATADLEEALGPMPADAGGPYELVRLPSIEAILKASDVDTAFQPIVRLSGDAPRLIGFEALTRFRGSWRAEGPQPLFDYAEKRARLTDLNFLTVGRALHEAASLTGDPLLFLNVDPVSFEDARLAPTLLTMGPRAGIALDRLVVEITERSAFHDSAAAERTCDALREAGVRLALDDHNSAYSHLPLIDAIRPAFIKVSTTFGCGLENDSVKQRIVRNAVALARDFGCQTILEGIENEATAALALELEIDFGQGWLFGRPAAATDWRSGIPIVAA